MLFIIIDVRYDVNNVKLNNNTGKINHKCIHLIDHIIDHHIVIVTNRDTQYYLQICILKINISTYSTSIQISTNRLNRPIFVCIHKRFPSSQDFCTFPLGLLTNIHITIQSFNLMVKYYRWRVVVVALQESKAKTDMTNFTEE